jgi:hypothetical protein
MLLYETGGYSFVWGGVNKKTLRHSIFIHSLTAQKKFRTVCADGAGAQKKVAVYWFSFLPQFFLL